MSLSSGRIEELNLANAGNENPRSNGKGQTKKAESSYASIEVWSYFVGFVENILWQDLSGLHSTDSGNANCSDDWSRWFVGLHGH